METLYIVMPAYNEAANLRKAVEEWYPILDLASEASRILVINDGSKDRTWEICEELQREYPRFTAVNQANAGHGPACLNAYRTAIARGADFIFQTDSDGQTRPEDFYALWEERGYYVLNIGYRHHREDGRSRVLVSRVLRALLRLRLGVTVKDPNTPFRLMPRERLGQWLESIPEQFFLANAALTAVAAYRGDRICWHPITFRPRQGGVNSINLKKMFRIGVTAFRDFGRIKRDLQARYGKPRQGEQTVMPVRADG